MSPTLHGTLFTSRRRLSTNMSVAILVPAYNEEQVLDKTLKAAVRG
jgi:cellulose synthase/poly-beta-1,6-N-acetylglucosamine synthase-like glycosyltransferase